MQFLNTSRLMRINLITLLLLQFTAYCVYAQWTKINVDTLGYLPFIPVAADIGEDGDLDFVVPAIINLDTFEGQIVLYEGPDWTKRVLDTQLSFINKIVDINGDQKVDILAGNLNSGEVVWYEAPDWTRHVIDTLQTAMAVDFADLNNDQKPDIIAMGQRLVWYEAPDWTVHTINADPQSDIFPLVANMDNDEDMDILSGQAGAMGWYENPGWTFHSIEAAPGDINQISLGDMDQDGDDDILVTDASAEQVIWYERPSWTKHVLDQFNYPWGSLITDMNNDTIVDVVISDENSGELFWYEAPSWTQHYIDDALPGAAGLAFADIGDGHQYIIVSAFGSASEIGLITVYRSGTGTGLDADRFDQIPVSVQLQQNYPNPFNPATVITYSIPNPGFITLTVYDIQGKEVRALVSKFQNEGRYSVKFDASEISGGIYFYTLNLGNLFSETKKMLLLR